MTPHLFSPQPQPLAPQPLTAQPPYSQALAPQAPRSRHGRTAALVLSVALVSGGAGGAVGAAAAADDEPAPLTDRATAVSTSATAGGAVSAVAAAVLPSVVSIDVRSRSGAGSGSGVVLDEAGHVLTNDHVVEPGVGGAISVLLSDGRRAPAEIVGRDAVTDLAVLRVDDVPGLQPIPLGRSSEVRVGDAVIAVGSPLGLSGTVTTGIVSALDRTVRTTPEAPLLGAIQTDAAINPGNSGGALLDEAGRLIGINTAISSTGGGSVGLGFAIPVDQARAIADELIRTGKATHPSLGVAATTVTSPEGARGAQLQQVPADSAAGRAGLRPDDVVVAVDGGAVSTVDELVLALREQGVGDQVPLTVLRDGSPEEVVVTLADRAA